ncbi:hypothetical protein SOVF_175600 [Spinacia oleracea]|uniref:Transmembrane protein n=1 Tax=Spinacia oleracea TaxID=3562 RepID=A0A9R0IAP7_SPIOL|nr:uncharacterized protein LOC110785717 [Spinacia oleracea]KNA07053.1 hypothetical protein SOVF_175600 [Spinacia oleracea]
MMRRQDHQHTNHNQQSRVLYELSSLVLNILRHPPSPSSLNFSDHHLYPPSSSSSAAAVRLPPQITPAGFASLMLGISLALMLCGSVTFFIGFMLLPWVIGLVMVFYFVGLVTSISVLGRAFLCYAISAPPSSSPSSPRKDFPAWKFL